jgi:hypothetical protein
MDQTQHRWKKKYKGLLNSGGEILEDNEESMATLKQILGKEFYNLNSHIQKNHVQFTRF